MPGPLQTQCLVFVVYADILEGKKRATSSSDRSKVNAYALLPHAVKCNHPEIVPIFSQNRVEIVDSDSEYPILYSGVKNNRVDMFEMLLDEDGEVYGSDSKSLGHLHMTVHGVNKKVAKDLFPNKITVHPRTKFSVASRSAVDEQNLKFMENVLGNGTGINYRRPEGGNLLHFAVEHYHEPLVKLLLKYRVDINATKKDGSTPLHIAADRGYTSIVDELLKYGANVNTYQFKGSTPLHLAVKRGHPEIVKLLLDSGADVDARSNSDATVLQLAVEKGCVESVETLLSHRPDINNENNKKAFCLAANETRSEYREIVQKLFDYGFTVGPEDTNNFAMFRGAVRLNCLSVVRKFLQLGVDLNDHERYSEIRSPLHVALEYANEDMVQLLLESGALIESECYYLKRTPIFSAAGRGRVKNLKVLLQAGARVEVKDIFGLSPLQVAAENGHPEVVEVLLKNNADVNVVCEKDRSALFYAVTNGHLEVIRILLAFGANSNVKDGYGSSPLHVASSKGHHEVVEILLQNEADVNARGSKGKTPLLLAVEKGYQKVVEQLLKFKACVNSKDFDGMAPLHIVSRLGATEMVKILLKNDADVNGTCLKERTPLFYAAVGGHLSVVEMLLRSAADTDCKDVDDKSVLYAAAVEGSFNVSETSERRRAHGGSGTAGDCPSVVELLLKFGALLDFRRNFNSAVFYVAVFSNPDAFKAILECCFVDLRPLSGANVNELFDSSRFTVCLANKLGQFTKAGDIFARHIIKIRAFTSCDFEKTPEPMWYCKEMTVSEYTRMCQEEVARLKGEKIGKTSVSYYDLLNKDVSRTSGFLRSDNNVQILKLREYKSTFPLYAGIIHYHFLKGNLRKELLKLAVKTCHLYFSHFSKLPYDLKEKVLSYLSNRDLKNILSICKTAIVNI